jgi:hypothetical protein
MPHPEGPTEAPPVPFEHTIARGLDAIERRFEPEPLPPGGEPVFMLASTWRSGSTLVQRLLVSSGELLMWGEPYDRAGLVRRLAESTMAFDEEWPPAPFIVDPANPPSAERWIANAYPAPEDLLAAHRALLDRLFAEPARRYGFRRWGLKEVRIGGEHALYLRRIYPDARFVFLHRNPYDAFLSYRLLHEIRSHSHWWYHRWPDHQVKTATQFGEMWNRLTSSFLEHAKGVGATVIAYEDIVLGSGAERLAGATGIDIDQSVLRNRIGATDQQRGTWEGAATSLRVDEIADLRAVAGRLARRLGYAGPTTSRGQP